MSFKIFQANMTWRREKSWKLRGHLIATQVYTYDLGISSCKSNLLMAKPAKDQKALRSKHNNGFKKAKKSISHSDKKRTKSKIEKLDDKGLLPSEIFKLNNSALHKNTPGSSSSLLARNLEQDRKTDQQTQDKVRAKKKETDNDILHQIEMISGFSL